LTVRDTSPLNLTELSGSGPREIYVHYDITFSSESA